MRVLCSILKIDAINQIGPTDNDDDGDDDEDDDFLLFRALT